MENQKLIDIVAKFQELKETDLQVKWKQVFEEVSVHTRKKLPEKLIKNKRPNEPEDIYQYRIANYRPITFGSINRSFDNLYRIFQSYSYQIKGSDDLNVFIKETKFEAETLKSFFEQKILRRMIEDPNGLLCWLPGGVGINEATEKIEPYPHLVYSYDIKYIDSDLFIYVGGQIPKTPNTADTNLYYAFDKEKFYKIYQSDANLYTLELIYTHDIGYLPCVVLGGDINADGYFESYFSPYLPFGDEAIVQFSDWQAVMVTSGFPYREELQISCDCNSGKILNKGTGVKEICKKCGGTGNYVTRSPYGTYLRNLPDKLDSNAADNMNVPSLRFISPPVDIVKLSEEVWKNLLIEAEKSLHLTKVEEAQSGVAKEVDREELYAFITKIANNFFDRVMTISLNTIEKYRNISSPEEIVILKPFDYSIKDENDLLTNLDNLSKSNAPQIFIGENLKDLAKKRFGANPFANKVFQMQYLYDNLFAYTPEQKAEMFSGNLIEKKDYIKSIYAYKIINDVAYEMGENEFIDSEYEALNTKFDAKLSQFIIITIPLIDNNTDEESIEQSTEE